MRERILELKKKKKSESGFVAAEFLFTFILVISCGLIVFALTFSLMTIEVAQYITWSSARAYSAGNVTKIASEEAARKKFTNLSAAFPLLTKGSSNWFELVIQRVGPVSSGLLKNLDPKNRMGTESRHPWSGVSSQIELKLFKSLRIPFLGPITEDEAIFKFPLHGFMYRNPSQGECLEFMIRRFDAIRALPDFSELSLESGRYIAPEDNGC